MKNSEHKTIKSEFLRLIVFGIIVGVASVTPGLSGGIIAVSLGIYAAALDAIVSIRQNFRKSVMYLLPLGIGAAVGILCFGIIMKPLLENFENNIIYLFLGLVVGSLPSFFKEASRGGFRLVYIIPALTAFSIGMILSGEIEEHAFGGTLTIPMLLLCGGVLSFGMVVPGISSSFILMQLGVYETLLTEFTSLNLYAVFWTGVGFVIVAVLSIKLISIAIHKYHGYAYFAAFGFLVSSVVSVIPTLTSAYEIFLNFVIAAAGAVLSYILMKKTV